MLAMPKDLKLVGEHYITIWRDASDGDNALQTTLWCSNLQSPATRLSLLGHKCDQQVTLQYGDISNQLHC